METVLLVLAIIYLIIMKVTASIESENDRRSLVDYNGIELLLFFTVLLVVIASIVLAELYLINYVASQFFEITWYETWLIWGLYFLLKRGK